MHGTQKRKFTSRSLKVDREEGEVVFLEAALKIGLSWYFLSHNWWCSEVTSGSALKYKSGKYIENQFGWQGSNSIGCMPGKSPTHSTISPVSRKGLWKQKIEGGTKMSSICGKNVRETEKRIHMRFLVYLMKSTDPVSPKGASGKKDSD